MLLVVFLFSKFKKQKKAFTLNLITKNKIQIQIQKTKNKVSNINKKQKTTNKKHKLYIINYKL